MTVLTPHPAAQPSLPTSCQPMQRGVANRYLPLLLVVLLVIATPVVAQTIQHPSEEPPQPEQQSGFLDLVHAIYQHAPEMPGEFDVAKGLLSNGVEGQKHAWLFLNKKQTMQRWDVDQRRLARKLLKKFHVDGDQVTKNFRLFGWMDNTANVSQIVGSLAADQPDYLKAGSQSLDILASGAMSGYGAKAGGLAGVKLGAMTGNPIGVLIGGTLGTISGALLGGQIHNWTIGKAISSGDEYLNKFRGAQTLFGALEMVRKRIAKAEQELSRGKQKQARQSALSAYQSLNRMQVMLSELGRGNEVLELTSRAVYVLVSIDKLERQQQVQQQPQDELDSGRQDPTGPGNSREITPDSWVGEWVASLDAQDDTRVRITRQGNEYQVQLIPSTNTATDEFFIPIPLDAMVMALFNGTYTRKNSSLVRESGLRIGSSGGGMSRSVRTTFTFEYVPHDDQLSWRITSSTNSGGGQPYRFRRVAR